MLLTDATDQMIGLAGGPGGWIRRDAASLPDPDQEIWHSLGGGPEAWICEDALPPRARFWRRIMVTRASPASQFDILRDRLAGHLTAGVEPFACAALTGEGFHGHRGRPWSALPGNLHLCVALAPERLAARHGLAMTVLPAIAVVDAIRAAGGGAIRSGIKWANDVLVAGRKVAGVISTTQTQGDRLDLAILGIGLNVERAPNIPTTPFTPGVDCLRQIPGGETLTLPRMLWAVLEALSDRFAALLRDGPDGLFRTYCEASLVVGRRVRIWEEGLDEGATFHHWPPPIARGVVQAIAPDLSLRLEGRSEPIAAGRLAFEEACRACGL